MSDITVAGRPWDAFDGYLFDIDGTLLHCADAVHYFAFCESLRIVSGRPLTIEGVTAHGNTDVGILRDAFALAGVSESEWRPRLPEILQVMGKYVRDHKQELCARVLPFVVEVLEHLTAKGATLGIATGNLKEIGELKLQHVDLLRFFLVGGWSDDFETRIDVFRHAIELMHEAAGKDAALCVLGDTPADVLAAHANGLPVIAVATGVYSKEELMQTLPDLCLESFADLFAKNRFDHSQSNRPAN